jgi:uncharacterized protein YacL
MLKKFVAGVKMTTHRIQKNPLKFACFSFVFAIISCAIRLCLIHLVSTSATHNHLVLFASVLISFALSILIFYIQFRYSKKTSLFFSKFIDLERIESNCLKMLYIEHEAEKESQLN